MGELLDKFERYGDAFGNWLANSIIGTLQIIAVLLVVAAAVFIAIFYLSPEDYADNYADDYPGVTKILARCGHVEEELKLDKNCIDSGDYMLSRDELQTRHQNIERFLLFCLDKESNGALQ